MSTRSCIGIENEQGKITGVYCHFDGYLSGVGQMLLDNYPTKELINELVSHGNISELCESVGVKHNFEDRPKGQTTYYGRDRGEEDEEAKTFDSAEEFVEGYDNSYAYLFRNDKWYVIIQNGEREAGLLVDALAGKEEDE